MTKEILFKSKQTRITSIAFISLIVIATSGCSSESFSEPQANEPESVSQTIRELREFNISIESQTRGESVLESKNSLKIPLADAKGAFEGARLGIKASYQLSNVSSSVGATAGGALIGATTSFDWYSMYIGASCQEFSDDFYDTERQPSDISSLSEDTKVDESYFNAAYAYSKSQIVENDYTLGLSYGCVSRDCIRIGILHNHILQYLSKALAGMIPQTFWNSLTQSEKDILLSDTFTEGRLFIRTACGYPTPIFVTEADMVMDLFSEAVLNSGKDNDRITSIIKQYLTSVKTSKDLSNDDKEALFSGFIVMAYSYQYWKPILDLK